MDIDQLASEFNQFFLLVCGIFVLFMQAGFAFLEAGSVRSKNTTNIIMKNLVDLFIGAIFYYAFGYAFAFGEPGNGFIGHNYFFASNVFDTNTTGNTTMYEFIKPEEDFYSNWFYQVAVAVTASTIVSGAMAERTEFVAYMVYSMIVTGFIYPVASHWAWSQTGWLYAGAGNLSFIDSAGSGVVHVLGGTAAFVGAAFLGPRIGRFNSDDGSYNDIPGHSITVASLGGFILFIGFLAFNGGSQLLVLQDGGSVLAASKAVVNTLLGGSIAAIVTMILFKATSAIKRQTQYWSLVMTINGGLAGMVAMCAGCNQYRPWFALIIGSMAGAAFIVWHHFLLKIKVDDPIDAVAVHLGGGLTGILLAPIFVENGLNENGVFVGGIVYGGHSLAFKSFGWNLLGTIAIMAWTGGCCTIMFWTMKALGVLRVSLQEEINGLDQKKHELAYPSRGYNNGEHPHSHSTQDISINGCSTPVKIENEVKKEIPVIEVFEVETTNA